VDLRVELDRKWSDRAKNEAFTEEGQFKALAKALKDCTGKFDVCITHGSAHQVTFKDLGLPWRQPSGLARCEISDLLIIVWTDNPFPSRRVKKREVRICFLQNKIDKRKGILGGGVGKEYNFPGNVEQWALLNRRPEVIGHGRFDPPPDILSSALVPAIGAFGVFYRSKSTGREMAYWPADVIVPSDLTGRKKILKVVSSGLSIRKSGHIPYCAQAKTRKEFVNSLIGMLVGSPIEWAHRSHEAAFKLIRYGMPGRSEWLGNFDDVVGELIRGLDGEPEIEQRQGVSDIQACANAVAGY
jgi:hypothetical protein